MLTCGARRAVRERGEAGRRAGLAQLNGPGLGGGRREAWWEKVGRPARKGRGCIILLDSNLDFLFKPKQILNYILLHK